MVIKLYKQRRRLFFRHFTPFNAFALLFLCTAALGVWAAPHRGPAWRKFWLIVLGLLFFYVLAYRPQDSRYQSLAINFRTFVYRWFLPAFGVAITLYLAMTHDWQAHPAEWAVITRAGRTLQQWLPIAPTTGIDANAVAGMLLLIVPFSLQGLLDAWRQGAIPALVASAGLTLVTLLGLLLTSSRGAWLALLAAMTLGGAWILLKRLPDRGNRRLWRLGIVLGLGFLAALILFGQRLQAPALTRTILGAGLAGRLEIYSDSVILLQDYPFIGAGLNNLSMIYSSYVYLIHVPFTKHAHSLYLNVALEQGVLGLLALLGMWACFLRGLRRGRRRDRANGRFAAGAGAAAISLLAIALHGVVEDALYAQAGVVLFFLPLSFVVHAPEWPPQTTAALPAEKTRRRHMKVLAILILIILIGLAGRRLLVSAVYANLAAVQQTRIVLGVYEWPQWPLQDEVRRRRDLSAPIGNFEQALRWYDKNPSANRRLGQIELSLGEYEDAVAHLTAAHDALPWDNATRQLLGEALIVTGNVEEGSRLWSSVDSDKGQLQIRLFWYEHIQDQERSERIARVVSGLAP